MVHVRSLEKKCLMNKHNTGLDEDAPKSRRTSQPLDIKGFVVSAIDLVMSRQLDWAKRYGLTPDSNGYLTSVRENLFAPLNAETEAAFGAGAGNELSDRPGEPAKMRAVHSSSALVCNVFDHWRRSDPGAISRALGIPDVPAAIHFEAQLPTGLRGTPSTLDLLVLGSDDLAWGIESKFTEPFQANKKRPTFAQSYFENEIGLWAKLGLPRCQALADQMKDGRVNFRHLDAPQLLKHSLGLRRKYPRGRLLLLWYDVDAPETKAFADEIQAFAQSVDEEIGFRAITYQQVFARLATETSVAPAYVEYIRNRYFAV